MSQIPDNVRDQIVDLSASPSPLEAYVFLCLAGTATISGIFVNVRGQQEGASFTGTVAGAPKTFTTLAGAVPPQAVGFVGRITGVNVSFGLGGQVGGGVGAYTPDSTYPIIAISDFVALGRTG
jgi:hypothetical protein